MRRLTPINIALTILLDIRFVIWQAPTSTSQSNAQRPFASWSSNAAQPSERLGNQKPESSSAVNGNSQSQSSTQNGASLPDLPAKPFSFGAEVKSKASQKSSPRSSKRISKLSQLPKLPDFEKQQQSTAYTAFAQPSYNQVESSQISDTQIDPLMPGRTPREASVDPFKDMIPNFLAGQIRTPSNRSVPVNFSQQNIPPVRLTPGSLYLLQ